METIYKRRIANKIGSREAFLAVGIALGIDLVLVVFAGFDNPNWLLANNFLLKLLSTAIIFVFMGQVFGRLAARLIILKKQSWMLHGPLCAWITLIATCMASGTVWFATDLTLQKTQLYAWHNYILVLALVVIIYSFIPVGIHGLWMGYRIYKKGKRHDHTEV